MLTWILARLGIHIPTQEELDAYIDRIVATWE